MDQTEISLIDLFQAIKKRFALIVILMIAFGAAAFLISTFLPEKYQTNATMMLVMPDSSDQLTQEGIDYNDIMLNQKLIETYSEFIKSRSVVEEVRQNLNLDLTYDQLKDMVSVTRLRNSEMISVVVTDTVPSRAMEIANEMVDVFRVKIAEALRISNIQVVDYAIQPVMPISPRVKFNTAIGLMLGLLLGLALAVGIEVFDTNIKTPDDITEYVGLPVLGMIPVEEVKGKSK